MTTPTKPPMMKPTGHAQNVITPHVCHAWSEDAFFDIESTRNAKPQLVAQRQLPQMWVQ
jgi:hypothetical protein